MHCSALHCIVLYCAVLYCTVLYCTVLYCTVLYYIVLYLPYPVAGHTDGGDGAEQCGALRHVLQLVVV